MPLEDSKWASSGDDEPETPKSTTTSSPFSAKLESRWADSNTEEETSLYKSKTPRRRNKQHSESAGYGNNKNARASHRRYDKKSDSLSSRIGLASPRPKSFENDYNDEEDDEIEDSRLNNVINFKNRALSSKPNRNQRPAKLSSLLDRILPVSNTDADDDGDYSSEDEQCEQKEEVLLEAPDIEESDEEESEPEALGSIDDLSPEARSFASRLGLGTPAATFSSSSNSSRASPKKKANARKQREEQRQKHRNDRLKDTHREWDSGRASPGHSYNLKHKSLSRHHREDIGDELRLYNDHNNHIQPKKKDGSKPYLRDKERHKHYNSRDPVTPTRYRNDYNENFPIEPNFEQRNAKNTENKNDATVEESQKQLQELQRQIQELKLQKQKLEDENSSKELEKYIENIQNQSKQLSWADWDD